MIDEYLIAYVILYSIFFVVIFIFMNYMFHSRRNLLSLALFFTTCIVIGFYLAIYLVLHLTNMS